MAEPRVKSYQTRAADLRTAIDGFPALVDGFLEASNLSARAFGGEAVGDPGFVGRLRNGRKFGEERRKSSFSLETVRRALDYMVAWRPKGSPRNPQATPPLDTFFD